MRNNLIAALAAGLAAFAVPLALADAIPPPQDLTAVQSEMVGIWRQTEQLPGRGHAETRTTFIFDQDKYTRVELQIVTMSNASSTFTESGAWTGKPAGDDAYELTLTPTGGKPAVLKLSVIGRAAITMQLWPGNPTQAKFERIFP